MKILHIKVNALINNEKKNELRKKIENDISEGLLITDKFMDVEILEIDEPSGISEKIKVDGEIIAEKLYTHEIRDMRTRGIK